MSSLLQQMELDEVQSECVSIILQCSNSLVHLIDDILDFSKLDARQMTLQTAPFALANLLQECADAVRSQASTKGLTLRVDCSAAAGYTAEADKRRLKQVILNLLSNAVKFTERGSVELSAAVTGEGAGPASLRVTVKDSGIGIPEDLRPRLFDRFTQADSSNTRKFGGTGLGLAISKQLVEAMGGQIVVESVPGCGSKFWFEIPMAASGQQGQEEDSLVAA